MLHKEAHFLLSCAYDSGSNSQRLQNLTTPELDWDLIFRASEEHALIPLVYNTLQAKSVIVPSAFLEKLRLHALRIASRNAALGRDLTGVLQLLDTNGIHAIANKGPVLAERLYRNVALRSSDDLDLLIQKENILKAKDILLKQGFQLKRGQGRISAVQERAFLRLHHSYDFISKNSDHCMKINWKIVPKTFSLTLDYEGIWNRSMLMRFDGMPVRVFSPEDLLLILCVGGKEHVWKRLSRIVDIAQTLRLHPDLDWQQLMSHAKKAGAERILFIGISLAAVLFEAPLSEQIRLQTDQDPVVRNLVKRIVEQVFSNPATMAQPEIAITPIVKESGSFPLPRIRYFVHHLLRPVRLTWRIMRRVTTYCFSSRNSPFSD